jgi:hypothetical protein
MVSQHFIHSHIYQIDHIRTYEGNDTALLRALYRFTHMFAIPGMIVVIWSEHEVVL